MKAILPKLAFTAAALFLVGCASGGKKAEASLPATAALPAAKSMAPADSPNMDANHDKTSLYAMDPNRTLPALFIVGDSTVHNTAPGLKGWGDVIGRFFDTNKIIVQNRALGGRSSRTFQTQGWWDNVLAAGRPGDFVLIQLGHNDGGPLDDTNRARGTIRGTGDESKEIFNPVMNKPEVVHTYGWYLRKYVSDTREKGMMPIICSPVPHMPKQAVKAGDIEKSDYVLWSGEVATNEHVPFINLNQIVLRQYTGITLEEIKTNYFTPQDNTHFSLAGAALNARSVVEGLLKLDCPLKNHLHPITEPAIISATNDLKL